MKDGMLQWHPIFSGTVQLGLGKETGEMILQAEFGLSNMPMRIDLLVIKKNEKPFDKDIGRILRGHNIFEYKSPGVTLSIDDFYKTYAYACFYKSNTEHVDEIPDNDITITFVCSQYPREMLKKLRNSRGLRPRQVAQGVYYLEKDPIPIQLILINQLSYKKNLWMSSLRTDLVPGEHLDMLMEDYRRHKDSKMYQEIMDVIVRANRKTIEEARNVCDALREIYAEDLERDVKKEVDRIMIILSKKMTQEITQKVTQQVTQKVTQQVTEEVTQQVTEEVTQQVTEEVTQQVLHKDIMTFTETLLEESYSEMFVCSKLQEKFSLSEKEAEAYIAEWKESLAGA